MASTGSLGAVGADPDKGEEFPEVFKALHSFSSALSSFTGRWKDLLSHLASIERSIDGRLEELDRLEELASKHEAGSTPPRVETAVASDDDDDDEGEGGGGGEGGEEEGGGGEEEGEEEEEEPEEEEEGEEEEEEPEEEEPEEEAGSEASDGCRELRSLCAAMDGQGLWSYVIENRKDLMTDPSELDTALVSSADPAHLVIYALDGSYRPGSKEVDVEQHLACQNLLERLQCLVPEIKSSVRDEAKNLAVRWKETFRAGEEDRMVVLAFLQLLATFQLLLDFNLDEVLDLIVSVSGEEKTVDVLKGLGLVEKMPDLIPKMKSKGRQLDAVKLIQGLNLLDDNWPKGIRRRAILTSFYKDCRKAAMEVIKKAPPSDETQAEAARIELAGVRQLLQFISEQQLNFEAFSADLNTRAEQLERQLAKSDQKRQAATGNANGTSNSSTQPQAKRPRLTTTSPPALPPSASHDIVPSVTQSQPVITRSRPVMPIPDQRPYIGLDGSYGLSSARSIYDPAVAAASGGTSGASGAPPPARPHPSPAVAGPRPSGRSTPYTYSLSSMSSYNPSYR